LKTNLGAEFNSRRSIHFSEGVYKPAFRRGKRVFCCPESSGKSIDSRRCEQALLNTSSLSIFLGFIDRKRIYWTDNSSARRPALHKLKETRCLLEPPRHEPSGQDSFNLPCEFNSGFNAPKCHSLATWSLKSW
jgi:hypothetical protein